MKTPIVAWATIPPDAVWCIGQHSKAERDRLNASMRAGIMRKVRAHWQGISPPKMVYIPIQPATIALPRAVGQHDWDTRTAFKPIEGDNFQITLARYAKGKFIIHTKGVDGYKSRACRLAGSITSERWTGRCKGYVASAAQAERFYRLYVAGYDASAITGELHEPAVDDQNPFLWRAASGSGRKSTWFVMRRIPHDLPDDHCRGSEVACGRTGNYRYFKSQSAAQRAADALNRS